MALIYNATFDKNTRKLSFEDRAGNEIYSFTVPERGPAVDDITKPLTFKATQDGSTLKLKKSGTPSGAFQTSRDGGNTWTDYTIDTAITLNTGDEVSFRAKSDRTSEQGDTRYFYFEMTGKIKAWHNVMSLYRPNDFATYNTVLRYAFSYLFTDCTSLTKAPELPATTLADYCYQNMFKGCSALTQAPVLPATALVYGCYSSMFEGCQSLTKAPELPATTLDGYCYQNMFKGCSALTQAPELPATTLAFNCYSSMFSDCQSLTKAPVLPATALVLGCYRGMFGGCQSLTKAPALPATTLVDYCYSGMFQGCQSLTKAPELPATTLADYCYQNMFKGCQSLTKAPELPATTLAAACYLGMFSGCQSLTKAPELPATTLAVGCYNSMFYGCQSLTKAPELPGTPLANYCYYHMFAGCQSLKEVRVSATRTATDALNDWLSGVSTTGDFYCDPSATIFPTDSASGIPANWRRLNINEEAPAVDDITKPLTFKATQDGSTVKLTKSGTPDGEFQTSRDGGNTWSDYTLDSAITLNTGDEVSFRSKSDRLSAQGLYDYFYFQMTGKIEAWHNVMSLYRTNNFATYESAWEYAFNSMFKDCTSLVKAPVLPATTLGRECYYLMFSGCTSLAEAPALPATTLAYSCYSNMFRGCTSLAEAPELPATTLYDGCYLALFIGCTSLVKAPELPATTLKRQCYRGMFQNCTSLTEAPELPVIRLDMDCYGFMFYGCTSLVNAPALPATKLNTDCYQYMFSGCQSLKEVRISATKTAQNALKEWLKNVSATGDFYCNPNATIFPSGVSGIPTNWTRRALADYPVTP